MTRIFTYDRFTPGAVLGDWEESLDAGLVAAWERLFGARPDDQPAQRAGLAVALMMRAYLNIVTPRPPGNIHARQELSLRGLPRSGETVRSRVRCIDKELRRDRRYLQLEISGVGEGGRALYTGRLRLIWAA